MTDRWLSPKQIAERYSVSGETARRWIIKLIEAEKKKDPRAGDPKTWATKTKGRWGKRPYSLRRVSEALLEQHLHELLNR